MLNPSFSIFHRQRPPRLPNSATLLALTANLFDPVPLERMTDAGHAVRESATTIPEEVSARFETATKLSDEDKKTVVEIARKALAAFQPKPEAKPEVKPETKPKVESPPPAEVKPSATVESKEKL